MEKSKNSYSKDRPFNSSNLDSNDSDKNVQALLARAETFQKQGAFEPALDILNKLIKPGNFNERAVFARAEIYRQQGKYQEALDDYSRIIELNPLSVEAFSKRGEVYRLEKNFEAALVDLNWAINLDPHSAKSLGRRGTIFRTLKNYDKALRDFNLAIELTPADTWLIGNRAEVYRSLREYPKALEDYNRVLNLNPALDWAYERRADLLNWLRSENPEFYKQYIDNLPTPAGESGPETSPSETVSQKVIPDPEKTQRLTKIPPGIKEGHKNGQTTRKFNGRVVRDTPAAFPQPAETVVPKVEENPVQAPKLPATTPDVSLQRPPLVEIKPVTLSNQPEPLPAETGLKEQPVPDETPQAGPDEKLQAEPGEIAQVYSLPVQKAVNQPEPELEPAKSSVNPALKSPSAGPERPLPAASVDFPAAPVDFPAAPVDEGKQTSRLKITLLAAILGIVVIGLLGWLAFFIISSRPGNQPAAVSPVSPAVSGLVGSTGPASNNPTSATRAISESPLAAPTSAPIANPTTAVSLTPTPPTPVQTSQTRETSPAATAVSTAPAQTVAATLVPSTTVNLEGHKGEVREVSWSSDGRYYVTASNDKTLKVWDASTNQVIKTLDDKVRPNTEAVLTARWSADNQYIIAGSADKYVRIYSIFPKQAIAQSAVGSVLIEATDKVVPLSVALAPDNSLVLYPGPGVVHSWDMSKDEQGPDFALNSPGTTVTTLDFTKDGAYLTIGLSNGEVQIWDVKGDKLLLAIPPGQAAPGPVVKLAWLPGEKQLVIGYKATLMIYTLSFTNGSIARLSSLALPVNIQINSLAVSPDGKRLALGSPTGQVELWSLEDNRLISRFSSRPVPVIGLHWNLNGKEILVAGGGDKPFLADYRVPAA
jgi:regulator of sirC expression with transglutaminase-like and TPR domain